MDGDAGNGQGSLKLTSQVRGQSMYSAKTEWEGNLVHKHNLTYDSLHHVHFLLDLTWNWNWMSFWH